MELSFFYGLLPLPLWGYALVTFGLVQIMVLGITLYLHRDQSHGGLQLHPALRHVFRFWLWLSSGTVTREWVAVHRRHHAYTDRAGDPHSPVIFGLARVLREGYELYSVAARDPELVANYGRGTPDDGIERHLYSRYPKAGLVIFVLLQLVLFGVPAITMLAIQLVAQPLLAAGVINGLGHAVGYRSFEMPASATNIVPWGLLIGGEELHNNHHAFPSSPAPVGAAVGDRHRVAVDLRVSRGGTGAGQQSRAGAADDERGTRDRRGDGAAPSLPIECTCCATIAGA